MVRGSLLVCLSDLSLLSDFIGVRLSPLGDCSCLGVIVPAVALFVVLLEMIGDGVVPVGVVDLCDSMLFCVDGEWRDLERLDGIGTLGG